jgi:hypothetical protein
MVVLATGIRASLGFVERQGQTSVNRVKLGATPPQINELALPGGKSSRRTDPVVDREILLERHFVKSIRVLTGCTC